LNLYLQTSSLTANLLPNCKPPLTNTLREDEGSSGDSSSDDEGAEGNQSLVPQSKIVILALTLYIQPLIGFTLEP